MNETKFIKIDGDEVSIPAERLNRNYAAGRIEEYFNVKNVRVYPGILLYPSFENNHFNAIIVWKGEVTSPESKQIAVGFYKIAEGSFLEVPTEFTFIPFSSNRSLINNKMCCYFVNGVFKVVKRGYH